MLLLSFFLLGSWLCHASKVVDEVEMNKHKEFAQRLVKLAETLLRLDSADSAVDIPMGTKEVAMGDAMGGTGEGALGGGSRGGLKIGQQIGWGKNQKVTLEMSSKGVLCASKHAKESESQILEKLKGLENVSQLEEVKDGRILIKFINGVELEKYRAMLAIHGETMAPKYVAALMRQLLLILQQIHLRKVVHLDAWTGNMMLSEDDGRLKLIDFDLAHDIKEGQQKITDPTHPSFGAPDNKSSEKTDVWYVGMATLHLLMGGHGNQHIQSNEHITKKLIPIRFPEGPIRDFILDCLKAKPADRPSIEQLLKSKFIAEAANDKELAEEIPKWIAWYRQNKDKPVDAFKGQVTMNAIFLRQIRKRIPQILVAKLLPNDWISSDAPKLDITQIAVMISRENNLTTVSLIPEHRELLKNEKNKIAFFDFFAQEEAIGTFTIDSLQRRAINESELSAMWEEVLTAPKI